MLLSRRDSFLAIVETGSLSAVARAWGVAPSTVTLLLQQLEERVGTRLLFRTTRQLSLTKDGEHFLERSRKILDDLDDLMEGFREEGALQGAYQDHGHQMILDVNILRRWCMLS